MRAVMKDKRQHCDHSKEIVTNLRQATSMRGPAMLSVGDCIIFLQHRAEFH